MTISKYAMAVPNHLTTRLKHEMAITNHVMAVTYQVMAVTKHLMVLTRIEWSSHNIVWL